MYENYKGAKEFPMQVTHYLRTEWECNAVMGTFKNRRVILDLNSCTSRAVNDYVPKYWYREESVSSIFPRQIGICPSNYNLVVYIWRKKIFCDTVLTMGCRSSAQICQRVTRTIVFIMLMIGLSPRKSTPPSEIMNFWGVLFNRGYFSEEKASKRQVQSLFWKLNFAGACVSQSRVLVARILNWLRGLYKVEVKDKLNIISIQDLIWWNRYLPLFNGISMMSVNSWSESDRN
ncbi:LOW QUALITY PROTEIN: hypothetical protein MAR_037743, partial [Mya arenaria]